MQREEKVLPVTVNQMTTKLNNPIKNHCWNWFCLALTIAAQIKIG
jgi:hypothetical protein